MDEDVAYVGFVNNHPNVRTIKCPNSKWAQCDCPVASEGMICKPTIKVFKMLHLGIEDGAIVCEASTRHGTQCGTPKKHCYARLLQQTTEIHVLDDVGTPFKVEHVVHDNVLQVDVNEEHTILTHMDPLFVDSENPLQFSSQFTHIDPNVVTLSQESFSQATPAAIAQDIYASLALNAEQHPVLQNHLIVGLRQIRGKAELADSTRCYTDAIDPMTTSFLEWSDDNSLKCRRRFLEFPLLKKKLFNSK